MEQAAPQQTVIKIEPRQSAGDLRAGLQPYSSVYGAWMYPGYPPYDRPHHPPSTTPGARSSVDSPGAWASRRRARCSAAATGAAATSTST